jgi:hypothetical protein
MLLSKTMTCKREQEWGGSRPHLKQRRIEEESTRVEIEIAQCSRNFIENKHYRHIRFLLPTTVQLQRWQLAEDPDRRTSLLFAIGGRHTLNQKLNALIGSTLLICTTKKNSNSCIIDAPLSMRNDNANAVVNLPLPS